MIVRLHQEIDDRKREQILDLCQAGACCADGQIHMLNTTTRNNSQLSEARWGSTSYHDRKVQALLDIASQTVKAINIQSNEGLSGEGISIAILDIGFILIPTW